MTQSEIVEQQERFDLLLETEWDLFTIGKKFTEKSKVTSASAYTYLHEFLTSEGIHPSMIHPLRKGFYSNILLNTALEQYSKWSNFM